MSVFSKGFLTVREGGRKEGRWVIKDNNANDSE